MHPCTITRMMTYLFQMCSQKIRMKTVVNNNVFLIKSTSLLVRKQLFYIDIETTTIAQQLTNIYMPYDYISLYDHLSHNEILFSSFSFHFLLQQVLNPFYLTLQKLSAMFFNSRHNAFYRRCRGLSDPPFHFNVLSTLRQLSKQIKQCCCFLSALVYKVMPYTVNFNFKSAKVNFTYFYENIFQVSHINFQKNFSVKYFD